MFTFGTLYYEKIKSSSFVKHDMTKHFLGFAVIVSEKRVKNVLSSARDVTKSYTKFVAFL